jgi:hypothetical protein
MVDKNKKLVMLGIIVVCFTLVVAIASYRKYKEGSVPRGIDSIKRGDMIWVKCSNTECEAEYQMGKRNYFEFLQANPPTPDQFVARMTDPNTRPMTPLVCRDCQKESAYRGEKCDKCGIVFIRSSIPHDFADRCPECNYSRTEDERKQAHKTRAERDN